MKRLLPWALCLLSCARHPNETGKGAGEAPPGAEDKAPGHADEPEHESLPRRVRLTAEVVKDAGIRTQPVTQGRLTISQEVPGELVADPDRAADVAARIAGHIDRVSFHEGALVKAGDVLAVVRAPELGQLHASYVSLSARSVAAQKNAERVSALAKDRLAAAQEVAVAEAEARALSADARAAGEHLRALGLGPDDNGSSSSLALRAPLSGTVITRNAIVGQPVTPEQVVATIVDLDEMWFLARVFERNLAQVRVGARAEVQLNAYPGERFEGRVEYISERIDPVARTLVARIRVKNAGHLLRIGLFGMARIESGDQKNPTPTLIVPRTAITEIGGKPVVFVRQPDGDFELHEVVLGDSSVGQVAVLGGLRKGEEIVVDGVFALKSVVLKGMLAEED